MDTISYEKAIADIEANPTKRIFWRSGWAYKGASECEIVRNPDCYPMTVGVCIDLRMSRRTFLSWKDALKAKFDWACEVCLDRNDENEIHMTGLSCNDMM